jgi:hypothetical protein
MTDTAPTSRPGRNARRRAHTEAEIERAYEAGVRDGRAEGTRPAPADTDLRDRMIQALYRHAVTGGGRYPDTRGSPTWRNRHTAPSTGGASSPAVPPPTRPTPAPRPASDGCGPPPRPSCCAPTTPTS